MPTDPHIQQLAQTIAEQFSALSEVEAVTLGGSHSTDTADNASDMDLYVYARDGKVNLDSRRALLQDRADTFELDNRFWEPGDEWLERESGTHIDVIYRDVGWIIDEIYTITVRHRARLGYSTCLWYNVLHTTPLYDRGNWFAELQKGARQTGYPDALMIAIIKKNHPVLRKNLSSYLHQIERAQARGDFVSVQHRVTALLASYFDILFALNKLPHPGEKRMLAFAERECEKQPPDMREQVTAVLYTDNRVQSVNHLINGLDDLLIAEGLLPHRML